MEILFNQKWYFLYLISFNVNSNLNFNLNLWQIFWKSFRTKIVLICQNTVCSNCPVNNFVTFSHFFLFGCQSWNFLFLNYFWRQEIVAPRHSTVISIWKKNKFFLKIYAAVATTGQNIPIRSKGKIFQKCIWHLWLILKLWDEENGSTLKTLF